MCECDLDYRCPKHDTIAEMLEALGNIPVTTITLDERADRVYEATPWKYADYELV